MLDGVWNAKEKNLFRAGMHKWFRREYFVDKSSDAVINKQRQADNFKKYKTKQIPKMDI